MSEKFLLPSGLTLDRLQKRLAPGFAGVAYGSRDETFVYLDSFDWRLFGAGFILRARRSGREWHLQLLDTADGERVISDAVAGSRLPGWPQDIPAGKLVRRLERLLEMRALLPLVEVDQHSQPLSILDDAEKTVIRLNYEQYRCCAVECTEPRTLLPRVSLECLKGYTEECQRLKAFLDAELQLAAAPLSVFAEALVSVGREPGDYSSKLDIRLKSGITAWNAFKRIALDLLRTLERNVPGTMRGIDSEFLHDLRVATRRTRSLLSAMDSVLPADQYEDFSKRFGWLGRITGPLRDADVFLLNYPQYRSAIAPAMQPDMEPVHDYLIRLQKREQTKLRKELLSREFQTLLRDWHALLEDADFEDALPAVAAQPIGDYAAEHIWVAYKRVAKLGRAIEDDSPDSMLHRLRKRCKKLRYLLEFYRSLFPATELDPLIKTQKRLLDNLGDIQDLVVQAAELRDVAVRLQSARQDMLSTTLAVGAIIDQLLLRQQQARGEFAERFATFDDPQGRAAYRQLFKPKKPVS